MCLTTSNPTFLSSLVIKENKATLNLKHLLLGGGPHSRYSPKRELAKPYHSQPLSPISHLPFRLAAKLSGVPNTHTRMSLRLMFSRMRLMGVRRERYLTKTRKTTELPKTPASRMVPSITATTVWPVRLMPPGPWGTQGPLTEVSGVLKLYSWVWRTISEGERVAAQQEILRSSPGAGGEVGAPVHTTLTLSLSLSHVRSLSLFLSLPPGLFIPLYVSLIRSFSLLLTPFDQTNLSELLIQIYIRENLV